MKCYGKTDVGRVRVSNQDAFGIFELTDGAYLAVVCDGMGGANAGNIASATATEFITEYVRRSCRKGMTAEEHISVLQNAVRSANIAVYDLASKHTEYEGMGTTVVAVIATSESAAIVHIGDSRLYLIHGDAIQQLTRDHSVVQNLIESGQLTLEEAKRHPRKNVITRALGISEDVYADCNVISLEKDDILLLCSDGLTNFIEDSDLLALIQSAEAEQAVETLIARANYNGGGDNITAVIVKNDGKDGID